MSASISIGRYLGVMPGLSRGFPKKFFTSVWPMFSPRGAIGVRAARQAL
jgi:hypothetical protein